VEINHRTRKRKKMPAETEADAGLSSKDETNRVMKSALDAIMAGMNSRFDQLNQLRATFGSLEDILKDCSLLMLKVLT